VKKKAPRRRPTFADLARSSGLGIRLERIETALGLRGRPKVVILLDLCAPGACEHQGRCDRERERRAASPPPPPPPSPAHWTPPRPSTAPPQKFAVSYLAAFGRDGRPKDPSTARWPA
jgi:hypothetical protein